jgi:exosortase H (IPTLxxWG-CTERM-specific)
MVGVMADVGEPRRERRTELRFCLVFALLTVAVFALLYAAHDLIVVPINRHIAWLGGAALRALGASAVTAGPVISAKGFAVEIKNNCNAVFEFGLYAAAVCAYPTSPASKAAGILAGATMIYTLNMLRVVSLVLLGVFAREWFELGHLYAWQILFFAAVVACWFAWIARVRPRA